MSKSEYRPPPAPNYNSHSSQQGYSAGNDSYYPPPSHPPEYSAPPQGYSHNYQQQHHVQQQNHYQQQPYYQQPYVHQYPQQQQQPVYVQNQQQRGGFGPGTDAWSWCCGFLSLAMCVEMLLILIPF